MRAYSNALHIEPGADEKRVALAREVVTKCLGAAHGSQQRYESLIANAKAALEASPLAGAVESEALEWHVVDDYGMGTRKLWPVV